jgi:hypothetical protein
MTRVGYCNPNVVRTVNYVNYDLGFYSWIDAAGGKEKKRSGCGPGTRAVAVSQQTGEREVDR